MPSTKLTLLAISLAVASLRFGTAEETGSLKAMLGLFSNEAEGFYTKSVLLIENGKGMYQGVPMLWTHDPKSNEVTVTLPPDAELETYSFRLRFDPAKEEFTILDEKLAEGSKPLHRIRAEIPTTIIDGLKKFDGTLKSLQR